MTEEDRVGRRVRPDGVGVLVWCVVQTTGRHSVRHPSGRDLSGRHPSAALPGRPPPGPPKISFFFLLPSPFSSLFLSLGVFSLNSGGVMVLEREKKNENGSGRGKISATFWSPPPFGPPPTGPISIWA